jgi:hypothetical protein
MSLEMKEISHFQEISMEFNGEFSPDSNSTQEENKENASPRAKVCFHNF